MLWLAFGGCARAPAEAPAVPRTTPTAHAEGSSPGTSELSSGAAGAQRASLDRADYDAPGSGPEPPTVVNSSPQQAVQQLSPVRSAVGKKARPLPAPEGTTVLHIGDSFAGALGLELGRELEAHGINSVLKFETSTYIPTWAWDPKLDGYLSKFDPDLVVITLGGNELQVPHPEDRIRNIKKLIGRLRGTPCVWVAIPLWEGAKPRMIDVIRDNSAPCAFMDTNALIPQMARAKDKIHPSMSAREQWAKVAIDWLLEHRSPKGGKPWAMRQ